jgi:hypothetical protein
MKAINGLEIKSMQDEQGNDLFYPNPAKEESKMSLWDALFGADVAKIMKANYNSHCKNGYKDANGNKVRNIRDLQGNILREMELKDEDDKPAKQAAAAAPAVSIKDAIDVYKELTALKNPALNKAIEMQMNIIKSLINPILLNAEIETLQFILNLKKAEAKAAEAAKAAETTN